VQKRGFSVERAYPPAAQRREIEGTVSATYTINADGTVSNVRINSANPPGYFESAVQREAARMSFTPALRNCQPASEERDLNVQFKLQ